MDTPNPPSEAESSATQPWQESESDIDSDTDSTLSLPEEHNLSAEVYNTIFLDGYRAAMANIIEDWENEYEEPPSRKRPLASTSPAEAFRQGYNIAIAMSIMELGGEDETERWRHWTAQRWRGFL